ncbi:uncharacterized protein [Amphiura filiformis]|uniref:uncharacterized protein n=1 Tax=Amphiura filiformis TaxID=82378 RepID=UPI003B226772
MASSSGDRGRKNDRGTDQFLKQMFEKVRVTFSAGEGLAGYLPLEDPNFVKDLQSKTNVQLTCEVKYDTNGQKQPLQYSLEGALDEINEAKKFVDLWVRRSIGETGAGAKSQDTPSNGPVPHDVHHGRTDLDVGAEGRSRRENELRTKSRTPVPTDMMEDHDVRSRDLDSRHRSRGNGESHRKSRHGTSGSRRSGDQGRESQSGLTEDQQPPPPSRQRQREQPDETGHDSQSRRHVLGNDLGMQNATSNSRNGIEGSQDSAALPDQFLSASAGGISGHTRETKAAEKTPGDQNNYPRRGQNGVEGHRYQDDQVSPGSNLKERSPHPREVSSQPNAQFEEPMTSPEGADGRRFQTQESKENINFVPVDMGVFAYMKKMFGSQIKDVEKQFNVKITSEDMDVNESAMLKITPVGTASEETIRGANEAVVDLYSSVFSQLNHRVVELEGSSVRKETLQRAIGDVEKLYKEVMVKLSGSKVLIYGMKELDVKVAKAMVTNRLYDTARSSPSFQQQTARNDEEERSPDDHLSERPPHLGLEDGGQHVQHIETNEMHAANGDDDDDTSPRLPEDDIVDTPRTDTRTSAPIKYRLRQDRLSFRTSEGLKVRVYQGDITKEKIGAIVNAANEGLVHAGGVAGAIEKVAGSAMTTECKRHITKHGMLYPSQVVCTNAGNLPCQYVIHAVGPRWDEYRNKDECYETLKTTFFKCLEVADRKLLVAGICMPLISSGIFGMPITACIDALYAAITQFSQVWQRDTNLLQEVNVVEIDEDSVKTVQEHLIGKLTGDGHGAVVRHSDPGNQESEDVLGDGRYKTGSSDARNSDGRGNHGDMKPSSTGLLDRRNQQEVDNLFEANQSRLMHEGTQTSFLSSNVKDLHRDNRFAGSSQSDNDDLNRFGMHKFSSLPNLRSKRDDGYTDDLPGNYKYGSGSGEGSRMTQLSTHNNIDAGTTGFSREASTRQGHERLQNDTGQRGYGLHTTSGRPPSYQNSVADATSGRPPSYRSSAADLAPGATGGVENNSNETLIQSILNQHESGHQTPEQVAETQKLLDNLLGTGGRSSKEKRGRRTQSLDRGTRKSKGRDEDLGGYDLHVDARVKRRDDDDEEFRKCSVCYSRRDLTVRKDCDHMLCRSCHRIGLFKGACSLCKSKSKKSRTPRDGDDQRGRSKTKKTPLPDTKALNPLHGHKDFHVAHGAPTTGHRKGPMVAKTSSTTPSSSPDLAGDPAYQNTRLDPVGHAPERGTDYYNRHLLAGRTLPDSRKNSSRTEAWVATSDLGSSTKTYDHSNYSMDNIGARNESGRASPRQRRRQERELAANLSSEGQHQRMTSRDKQGGGGGRGGAAGGRGDAATSPPPSNASCPICMDTMTNPTTLSECKHSFCAACIDKAMKLKALCPVCGVVYGQLYGNQPAGTMTNYVEPTDLPGYEGCGTIVISYRFPDGTQGEDHPNPGQPFRGTARMAYIPNNIEGQEIFRLLEKAFKARLLFTIGQSVTTGEQNTVIWNDIHHKTRRTGGAENHGYPDPSYLKRVREELSCKGIK